MAGDKSLDVVLACIENRMTFRMISDELDLATCYGCLLAVGQIFDEANKRTAFACMDVCLSLNNAEMTYDYEEVGKLIIKAAQGIVDAVELSTRLRAQALS